MSTHPKQEVKTGSRERDDSPEDEAGGEGGGTPGMDAIRQKLKVVLHYAMIGFAPAVAVAALAVAVIAITGNRSGQVQSGELAARLDSANTNLAASRSEVERLHIALGQLKAQQEDEHKKQEEVLGKIIQNVSRLQAKMKVSPTLEDQLGHSASAPAIALTASTVAPATATVPVVAEKKHSPQLQSLKEAIKQFNRK